MYQQGFRWWNMGRAAAIAFVLFALILALSGVQQMLLRGDGPRELAEAARSGGQRRAGGARAW